MAVICEKCGGEMAQATQKRKGNRGFFARIFASMFFIAIAVSLALWGLFEWAEESDWATWIFVGAAFFGLGSVGTLFDSGEETVKIMKCRQCGYFYDVAD